MWEGLGVVKREDTGKMGEVVFTAASGETMINETTDMGEEQQREIVQKDTW